MILYTHASKELIHTIFVFLPSINLNLSPAQVLKKLIIECYL